MRNDSYPSPISTWCIVRIRYSGKVARQIPQARVHSKSVLQTKPNWTKSYCKISSSFKSNFENSESPRSTASSRSDSRSASSSPAPDFSQTRSPLATQSSPPSASALNDPKKRRKQGYPRNRAQPGQEHQAPQRFSSPTPEDVSRDLYGRVVKVSPPGGPTLSMPRWSLEEDPWAGSTPTPEGMSHYSW